MSRRNVGMVPDLHDDENHGMVPVRINSAGQYYYLSQVAQPVRMRVGKGDQWVDKHAVMWGDGEPPADCPEWIAADKTEPPRERRPVGRPRKNPPAAPIEPPPAAPIEPRPAAPIEPPPADDEVSFL